MVIMYLLKKYLVNKIYFLHWDVKLIEGSRQGSSFYDQLLATIQDVSK